MARRRRYMNRTMYNYSTSGGPIQEDFGAIGEKFLEGTKYVNAIRRAEVEKIQKQQEEIIKLTDFPMTGNADVNIMANRISEGIRNDLMKNRKMIGVDGYTRADFNEAYSNSMASAKTYTGMQEYMKNEIERIDADETLSDVTKDLYMKSLGSVFNPNSIYDVRVSNGSIIIDEYLGKDKDGNPITQQTDVKRFMMNGGQDINKFDPLEAYGELQKLYMGKNQNFEYSVEDIAGNPALLTKHITGNPEQFGTFLDNYLKNFAASDEKVIAFLYDEMGVELGPDGLKHQDGKVILTDEQRQQAKESFKGYLLDQVGVKEEGRFQFVPQQRASSGAYKASMTVSQGGNIVPRGATGYGQNFEFQDIAKSYMAGTTALADPSIEQGIANAYSADERTYKDTTGGQSLFVQRNADLYDASGNNKIYAPPTTETQPDEQGNYPSNVSFEHVSLGLDLSPNEFKDKITANSNQNFNAISGIVFTMGYTTEAGEGPEDPSKIVAFPSGIRLVGPVTYQETQAIGGSKATSSGQVTIEGTADVQRKSITGKGTSNLLSPDDISLVLRQLYDQNPNLEGYYNSLKSRNPDLTDVQALYYMMQSLKS